MPDQSKYIYLGKGTLIESDDYNDYIIESEQTTNNKDNKDKCNIPQGTNEVYVALYIPLKNEEGTVANDLENAFHVPTGEHKIILSIKDPKEDKGEFYDYNINYENNEHYNPCKYKSNCTS